MAKGHWGLGEGGGGRGARGGGGVLFLGINGPEKHLSVFRFIKTHRLKWPNGHRGCVCVRLDKRPPKFHTQRICLTDVKQGRSTEKQQVYVE
jgi:hypothetical protein